MAPAGRLRPWAATVTATAVSTDALDGVATAAGKQMGVAGWIPDNMSASTMLDQTFACTARRRERRERLARL